MLKGRLQVSDLTIRQIKFCEHYILTRDIKQSSLSAGYSESYSKSKAYELLQDERIQKKINTLESEHNQNHFKRLSIIANKELENILLDDDNSNTKLRAIELIYKLSGVIQDDKVSLNINNKNQVLTIDDIYNTKTLDDFYKNDTKKIVKSTIKEFDDKY